MKGHHRDPQDVVIRMLVVNALGHVGGQRPDNAVAQQNAKKGSHECGGDLVAHLRRRSAQRSHGDHNAQHGRYDAEPRQSISHGRQSLRGQHGCAMVDLQVQLHHLVHVERLHPAGYSHAHGVAYKSRHVMIL